MVFFWSILCFYMIDMIYSELSYILSEKGDINFLKTIQGLKSKNEIFDMTFPLTFPFLTYFISRCVYPSLCVGACVRSLVCRFITHIFLPKSRQND